mmetsp:Transcript_47228/g.107049  ORF Transcript_47228/g.107049 Transcript_47228/m.107049 type:complete len:243 (+) Transcript_47228:88-816(+)
MAGVCESDAPRGELLGGPAESDAATRGAYARRLGGGEVIWGPNKVPLPRGAAAHRDGAARGARDQPSRNSRRNSRRRARGRRVAGGQPRELRGRELRGRVCGGVAGGARLGRFAGGRVRRSGGGPEPRVHAERGHPTPKPGRARAGRADQVRLALLRGRAGLHERRLPRLAQLRRVLRLLCHPQGSPDATQGLGRGQGLSRHQLCHPIRSRPYAERLGQRPARRPVRFAAGSGSTSGLGGGG